MHLIDCSFNIVFQSRAYSLFPHVVLDQINRIKTLHITHGHVFFYIFTELFDLC